MSGKPEAPVRKLTDMLGEDVDAYFASGGDLAIIPIGSIEQHGPHLLTGTDGYITLAKATEVARISGGVLFPMISYCWEGVTNNFSGGVGVREQVFVDYVRAVVRGVRHAGFRRILIMNSHGGNYYAMRSLAYQTLSEDGVVVLTVYGTCHCPPPPDGRGTSEAESLLGALRMLGREDLIGEVIEYTRKAIAEFGDRPVCKHEPECLRQARKLGSVGFDYWSECEHVSPDSSKMESDPGVAWLKRIAEHVAASLPALAGYAEDTERLGAEKG